MANPWFIVKRGAHFQDLLLLKSRSTRKELEKDPDVLAFSHDPVNAVELALKAIDQQIETIRRSKEGLVSMLSMYVDIKKR